MALAIAVGHTNDGYVWVQAEGDMMGLEAKRLIIFEPDTAAMIQEKISGLIGDAGKSSRRIEKVKEGPVTVILGFTGDRQIWFECSIPTKSGIQETKMQIEIALADTMQRHLKGAVKAARSAKKHIEMAMQREIKINMA